MSANTPIEWTDHTFNAWWGCSEVSPGCDNCYARIWAARFGVKWGADGPRRAFDDKHWAEPLKWDRAAKKAGKRARVFCASMADVFDKNAPDGARDRLWKLIADTPNLDWQLLTKRIGNAPRMLPADWGNGYANVWIGASVVNQEEADRDISKLLAVPARVRFLSCEPLLGQIDIRRWLCPDFIAHPQLHRNPNEQRALAAIAKAGARQIGWTGIDWVISGGESGRKARPSHPDWHRSLRDQCAAAGVPFLFKQFGEWAPAQNLPGKNFRFENSNGPAIYVTRIGKKAAGRILDGRTHDEYPASISAPSR